MKKLNYRSSLALLVILFVIGINSCGPSAEEIENEKLEGTRIKVIENFISNSTGQISIVQIDCVEYIVTYSGGIIKHDTLVN